MKKILEKNIVLFFSVIIFGGLLWGFSGLGFLMGKNWNIVNFLLGSNRRVEGVVYIFIGLSTLAKATYNMLWDKPKDAPWIVFIIFVVVAAGFYWGIIGFGLIFGINLNLMEILPVNAGNILAVANYTIGIFALIKLFNFIHTKKIEKQRLVDND